MGKVSTTFSVFVPDLGIPDHHEPWVKFAFEARSRQPSRTNRVSSDRIVGKGQGCIAAHCFHVVMAKDCAHEGSPRARASGEHSTDRVLTFQKNRSDYSANPVAGIMAQVVATT